MDWYTRQQGKITVEIDNTMHCINKSKIGIMTCLNQHWISYKPLSKRQFKPYENPTLINGENIQTTINNTKHPQYNHTLPHNIPSQTKFNLNI